MILICWGLLFFFPRLSFLDYGFLICKMWNLVSMWHITAISLIGHSWNEGQPIMGSKWVMYVVNFLVFGNWLLLNGKQVNVLVGMSAQFSISLWWCMYFLFLVCSVRTENCSLSIWAWIRLCYKIVLLVIFA